MPQIRFPCHAKSYEVTSSATSLARWFFAFVFFSSDWFTLLPIPCEDSGIRGHEDVRLCVRSSLSLKKTTRNQTLTFSILYLLYLYLLCFGVSFRSRLGSVQL